MSLARFLKYLEGQGGAAAKLAEAGNKTARYSTLKALERALPLHKETQETIHGMLPKGNWGITQSYNPGAAAADINGLEKAFTTKINDNMRHKEWSYLGQPSLGEMNQFSEDLATPLGDKLGLSADETEDSLRQLQKIYGYVAHRHPDFPDAMIENKIPGFTKWMLQKKGGQ